MTRSFSTSNTVWQHRLQSLKEDGLERILRSMPGPAGPTVSTKEGVCHIFCSNDYLGLADHPDIKKAMTAAVETWGNGAGASRLVSGNFEIHDAVERLSARFIGATDSVYFVSGYQANVGSLSALTDRGDLILSDELIHASLIDGARLSRAEVRVYRHSDMDHLRSLLENADSHRLKLIVTDAVFSMDGDVAKLSDIVELSKKYNAAVYLDEAHSIGVLGPQGRGLAVSQGLAEHIDIRIATFSKALGVSGAFVAAAETAVTRLIRSRARSLLFTTAPPPVLAGAILKSLEITASADIERARLNKNIQRFKAEAAARRMPLLPSDTPIQPVITGSNRRTMAVSEQLYQRGFFVQGIRPPTVPNDQGRLRVTLSAKHTTQSIHELVDAIHDALHTVEK